MSLIQSTLKKILSRNSDELSTPTVSSKKSLSHDDIAKHFDITQANVEEILLRLEWLEITNEGMQKTQKGEKMCIYTNTHKETKNTNIMWGEHIYSNEVFINELNAFINSYFSYKIS